MTGVIPLQRRLVGRFLTGGTALLAVRAHAQSKTYRIGFLTLDPDGKADLLAKPLEAIGYVLVRNLTID